MAFVRESDFHRFGRDVRRCPGGGPQCFDVQCALGPTTVWRVSDDQLFCMQLAATVFGPPQPDLEIPSASAMELLRAGETPEYVSLLVAAGQFED